MQIEITYKAAPDSHLRNEDAERIGRFLDKELAPKFGEDPIPATAVVEAARPQASPIHQDFEWDNAIAGEQYRLEQARKLMRSIVVVQRVDDKPESTRAFQHVVVKRGGVAVSGYVSQEVAWRRPDYAAQIVHTVRVKLRNLAALCDQYEQLAGAAGKIREAIEEIDEEES